MLRSWFEDERVIGAENARMIVEKVLENGLKPFVQPPVLPPIEPDDIDPICWMAVSPDVSA